MASILIIDDEPVFRRVTRAMLERLGHHVTELSEARHAREVYRASGPDLVILDMLMPDQDGLETLTKLREIDPQIRVVAVSGGGRLEAEFYLDFARRLRAAQHLAKPFTLAQLERTVNAALQSGAGEWQSRAAGSSAA